MKHIAPTKKQVILRLILLAVLLCAGIVILRLRACPHWEPVAITLHTDKTVPNPYIDPDGSAIYDYRGNTLSNANAAAVYTLSVGKECYQQCADTIIRLCSYAFHGSDALRRWKDGF